MLKYTRTYSPERAAAISVLKPYWEMKGKPEFDNFFPLNLREIAQHVLRWEVQEHTDLGITADGRRRIGKCIFPDRLILVLSESSEPEKRFSLAHEIGHAKLHKRSPNCHEESYSRIQSRRKRREKLLGNDGRLEIQANRFAAELLMPEKQVRIYFERLFGQLKKWVGSPSFLRKIGLENGYEVFPLESVAERVAIYKNSPEPKSLAGYFGVSKSAMALRIQKLGLIYL